MRSTRTSSRPLAASARLTAPLVAAALVALVAGGQVAGFAHHLHVRHATCAEHGEAIDVVATARDPGLSGAPAASRLAPAPPDGAPTDGHHRHCSIAFYRRDHAPPAARAGGLAWSAPAGPAPACALGAPGRLGIPILRLAPKSSPPSAVL